MKLKSLDLKALLLPHSGSVFRDIETGMTECLKYYRNSSQHSSLTSSQFQSLNIACAQSYADPIKNILFKCYSWQNMPLTSFKYRTASTGRQKRKKPLISHLTDPTQISCFPVCSWPRGAPRCDVRPGHGSQRSAGVTGNVQSIGGGRWRVQVPGGFKGLMLNSATQGKDKQVLSPPQCQAIVRNLKRF